MQHTSRAFVAVVLLAFTTGSVAAPPRRLARAELPAGFVVAEATAPFELRLPSVEGAGADATFVATPAVERDSTTLSIKSSAGTNVKVDLYISPDGERFVYTSSCPVMAGLVGIEHWPHPIHTFAIGNPRPAAADRMTCD